MKPTTLKLGTRGSPLALWQANRVGAWIAEKTGLACEIQIIRTRAEKFPDQNLAEIGIGIFTKELDDALNRGDIDLAVHSAKDIPSALTEGIEIAAFPERMSPFDTFVGAGPGTIAELPTGARIGTGSPRRKAQILSARPDLEIVPLRGNVDTRLRKIEEEGLAGTILAEAGLRRLGKDDVICEVLSPDLVLPAVGQGSIAVTTRTDGAARDAVRSIDEPTARTEVSIERAFLREIRGGCQAPAGALARVTESGIHVRAIIAELGGESVVRGGRQLSADASENAGAELARELLDKGGEDILRAIRGN